jgi:hypothetical protein
MLLIKSLLLRLNRFWLGSEVFASLFPTSSFSIYSYFYVPFLLFCPCCDYLAMVTTRTGSDIVEQRERDRHRGNERAREQTAAHMEELEQISASRDTPTPDNFHGNVLGFSDAHMSSLLNLVTNLQVEMSELRRSRRRSDSDEDPDERSDDDVITDVLTPDRSRIMSPNELSVLTYGDMRPAECHDSRFLAVLDYRYYRLNKRSGHYTAQTASSVARWTRQIEASFKLRFSGADPLAILQFLGAFVDATNSNGIL